MARAFLTQKKARKSTGLLRNMVLVWIKVLHLPVIGIVKRILLDLENAVLAFWTGKSRRSRPRK